MFYKVLIIVIHKKNIIMNKTIKLLTLALLVCSLTMFYSCKPEAVAVIEHEITTDHEEASLDLNYDEEVTAHVHSLNLDLDNLETFEFEYPDGTVEEKFLLENDVALTRQELEDLQEEMDGDLRQYRTYNLVNSPRTIRVLGYSGGQYALSSKMRTGLSWAVNNYNRLNTGLTFTLSYGTNTNANDIVVYNVNNGQAGGVAGFPSNGRPYKWVQIFSGMNNYNTNVVEHVITHEIGHCLGMRHTDWASRASCGQNSNEGQAGVGAVNVPGTPSGIDWNSLMLACFNGNTNGEFGYYDRVALERMY